MLTQSRQNMQPKILIYPSDKKTNAMNQTPLEQKHKAERYKITKTRR